MESLLTLINEVVDRPPSLTTSNTHPPQPPPPILSHNNPFDINKDGQNLTIDDSSDNKGKVQLSNSLPTPIFKSSISAALNLSVIPEQTELMTTVAESKLESRLLTTTNSTSKTLLSEGSSSSSDENSVSSLNSLESNNNKELAISEQEGKRVIEEVKEEDSSVIKSRHVNSNNNRDALFRITEQEEIINDNNKAEEKEKQKKENPLIIKIDYISKTVPIETEQACEISDILPQSSSPSFAIHSDKSILGEYYPNIKEPPSSVSVSPAPTPLLMAGDRYPPMTPLRSIKDFTRAGVLTSREVRYPSPGTFFAGKSGPLGDISGRLSPSKRPRFFSPNSNRNERWPTPTIDTTRPERSGRKTMEGWPTSPRRMQLASPRFKSLTDLVEETSENPEQIEIGGKRTESLKLPVQVSQKNISSLSLLEENDAIIKGSDEKKINYEEIQKEKIPADPEDDKEKEKENTPGKFSSRSVPLSEIVQSNDSEIPSKRFQSRSRSFAPKPPPIFSLRRSSASFKSENLGNEKSTKSLGLISEEEEEEEEEGEEGEGEEEKKQETKKPRNDKGKSRSERHISGLYNMPPLVENSELEEDIGEEEEEALDSTPTPSPIIKSSDLTSSSDIGRSIIQTSDINLSPRDSQTKKPGDNNFLRSIQTRRTERNVLTLKTRTNLLIISETEDEDDDESKSPDIAQTFNDRNISPPKSAPLLTSSTFDISPTSSKTSWRWPKRQFSPAREKCKEPNDSNDDPSMHIGKVGNLWAKKTLGQLRAYHKRHSPSIWSKGFGSSNSSSPLKETFSSVQISPVTPVAPVSDVEAIKSPMTPNLPVADQLETIDEEDDEEIGVWSSEEVDLTDSGKEDKKPNPPSPSSSIPINPSSIIEEITEPPQGMKVSPEHLTVVGGTAVYRENSPSSSNTSLQLRTNPNNSSLGKHNAKPLFETTFTISNITDRPLRYEILWPAFRFDVSPAYGIVQAKGVTVVKISVLMKHLNVGSKRDEIKDSKKLMGMLKGSTRIDKEKPLMGHTRILVLCENGERREVLVDIVQVKKKSKELEPVKNIKNVKDGGNTSTNRTFISGVSRTVGDLLMGKKLRKEKSNVKGKNPVIVDNNNNHNITSGSKLSRRSRSTSRNTSPDGKKVHSNRNKPSNRISRPSTPDYKLVDRRVSTSPQPIISRSRTPEEFRQLPQRKNLIYLGVPGNISCPDTNIRETANGVFRIHNPTNKHISWHLTTATNPFLKRSESSSQQKITDEVFLIMKTHGFLRPGQSERVDVSFRPLFVGTYVQNFMLEESMNSEAAGGLGGVSLRMQGEGKPDNSSSTLNERRRGIRGVDFVVSEKEIRIPTTRVGRRRSIGIKIENPSPQLIRIRCKCEVVSGAIGTSVLSIPLSSVQIKPKAFVLLPVRFQPKESGETKGVVKLQAVGKTEVKVDIIADGVVDTGPSIELSP